MKVFNISYQYTTLADVTVTAETKAEAIRRVKEILPEAERVQAWEVGNEK